MRHLIYILLFLCTLSASFAAVEIAPSSLDVTLFAPTSKQFEVTITNKLNDTIFNVNLSPSVSDVTPFFLQNLSPAESRSANITLSPTAGYDRVHNLNLIFFTKRNVTFSPTQEAVLIKNNGFVSNKLTIVKGSTVKFTNNDTISHTITSSLFDVVVDQGKDFSFTFNNGGQKVPYFDKITSFGGEIIVQDVLQSVFVHDPSTDVPFSIRLKSILAETNISLDLIDKTINTRPNQAKDGVLRVTNNGNKTVTNLRLTATNWTIFSTQNFNINPQENKLIVFSVTPFITSSAETNKNYSIIIQALADNALTVSGNLSVEIPFVENVAVNESDPGEVFRSRLIFCNAFPSSPFCITEPIVKYVNVTVYESPPLPYNYTQEDVDKLSQNYLTLKSEFFLLRNYVKEEVGIIQNDTASSKLASSVVDNRTATIDEKLNSISNTIIGLLVIIILIFLMICGGIGGYLLTNGISGIRGQERQYST